MILTVEKLGRMYRLGDRKLCVLDDVSFALAEGESLAVVGPSGSGKTTLLGICAGLDVPSRGCVTLCGDDLGSLSEDGRARLRNRNVGFVFQAFHLVPTLTALENVMVPLELRGERAIALKRARNLLERVGLGDRSGHYPLQLSGGEQQRVALARAFVNEPKILFADEPTGNLDTATGNMVADLLFELNSGFGTTLVMVTHDHELADRCRRVIRLRGGKVDFDETKQEPA